MGQGILNLSESIGIGPQYLVLYLKSIMYILFCVVFFFLALRKRFGIIELILFLAPWSIAFDLNDTFGSGRKELLLITAFTIYAFIYTYKVNYLNNFYRQWNF